jgi:hypothetical protein
MTFPKSRTFKLHEIKYFIIDGWLCWKDPLGFLLCCLKESETKGVIDEFHEEVWTTPCLERNNLQDFNGWILLDKVIYRFEHEGQSP